MIRIEARHSHPQAKNCSDDDVEGLYVELFASKGCRMMVTSNILRSFGLVNGTLGTLLDIIQYPNDDPRTTLPYMLLFKPDKYDGPDLSKDPADDKSVVPILPIRRQWEVGSEIYSRTMFPIVLAYAITIHKSQGLTLNKAVLDLSSRDFSVGQTYVAISRVRAVRGLMIDRLFDISRFAERPTELRRMRDEDYVIRQNQLIR